MTADLIEEVRKMLEGVTPGPWKVCETTIHGRKYGGCWVEGPEVDDGDGRIHGLLIPISGSGGARSYTTRLVDRQDHDHNDANARFIAWTREGVPALLARLEAAEAKLSECEARLGKAVETLNRIAHKNVHEDVFSRIAQETLAELKGSKNDR